MKKLYLQIVAFIVATIAIFGFILPWLFSAESDIAVILGIIVIIAYGYGLLVYLPKIYKTIINLNNEKK